MANLKAKLAAQAAAPAAADSYVTLIAKIKQANNLTFKLLDAVDIDWDGFDWDGVNIPSSSIPLASAKQDGLMAKGDKAFLDGVQGKLDAKVDKDGYIAYSQDEKDKLAGLVQTNGAVFVDMNIGSGIKFEVPEGTAAIHVGDILIDNAGDFYTAVKVEDDGVTPSDAFLSTKDVYNLPVATDQVLGGVKVGANVTRGNDGTISVSGTNVNAALGYTAGNDADVKTVQGYFDNGKAKTAAAADNASQLGGHEVDYFATADAVNQLKQSVSAAINYRGSVATKDDLADIENPAAGDMYNVTDSDMNYVYVPGKPAEGDTPAVDPSWDPMSATFTVDAITNEDIDAMFA